MFLEFYGNCRGKDRRSKDFRDNPKATAPSHGLTNQAVQISQPDWNLLKMPTSGHVWYSGHIHNTFGRAMFQNISQQILNRMRELEAIDSCDRNDGTERLARLRQIPPETGKFIALLAALSPAGRMIEIGTSAGYSALWLALACRETGRKLTTFELLEEKIELAKSTFDQAGVGDVIDLVWGDALAHLNIYDDIGFCFLDAEKEIYLDCYEIVIPRLVDGGILVADNAINHEKALRPMLDRALSDDRVDAMIVPIGKGELICRKKRQTGS